MPEFRTGHTGERRKFAALLMPVAGAVDQGRPTLDLLDLERLDALGLEEAWIGE